MDNKVTHIDTWIDDRIYGQCIDEEKYPLAFFLLRRMDVVTIITLAPIIKHHKLFCTYENKRYRVTGCSRLGDVWLHSDFIVDTGYTDRVIIDKCSNWSDKE